jgi:hypothetical protein
VDLAVLTTELLPAPPTGETYHAWVRHGDHWTSLGTLTPNADGNAQLIAQDSALKVSPEAVQITLESGGGNQAPGGQVILAWSAS